MSESTDLTNVEVTKEARDSFKEYCQKNGLTMKTYLSNIMLNHGLPKKIGKIAYEIVVKQEKPESFLITSSFLGHIGGDTEFIEVDREMTVERFFTLLNELHDID